MQTLRSANRHYEQQKQIAATTVASANKLWRHMGEDFDQSWAELRPAVESLVRTGRLAAAVSSAQYTPAVLAETGQVAAATGAINPAGFVEYAPDGRSMGTLLDETVIRAKFAVKAGQTVPEALSFAGRWMTGVLLTVMADTSRGVVAADIGMRPTLTGYVRMLNPPSCERCVILAGKWFRWNEGFQRHKRCDCRHIPASEDIGGDLRTDPYAYFRSLSAAEQDRMFGRIEARAIRDGADIYRVSNLKARGLGTVKSNALYGTPNKLSVDDIYRQAGHRTNAIKMLEQNGYITGPQVRGGNIFGQYYEGFGQLGKGGSARAASDAVKQASTSGARDPLNRYTMTAAERGLYDAKYKLDTALSGVYPQSVGANSADKYSPARRPTATEIEGFRADLAREVAKIPNAAPSVRNLASLLGLI